MKYYKIGQNVYEVEMDDKYLGRAPEFLVMDDVACMEIWKVDKDREGEHFIQCVKTKNPYEQCAYKCQYNALEQEFVCRGTPTSPGMYIMCPDLKGEYIESEILPRGI
jgi:hypothetical protein